MLRQKYELRSLHSENSSHKRDDWLLEIDLRLPWLIHFY
jgi:hypothetical protein